VSIDLCAKMVAMELENKEPTGKQSFWELVRFAAIAVAIVIPIRIFIAQPFIVSGSSMVPTFEDGEYLIIDEISYRFSDPKRDDVVVFRYPNNTKKFFIKRIIGLPGETVDIKEGSVTITNEANPEGLYIEEPYVKNVSSGNTHFVLKSDEYFVMGDNRTASSDSRYWGAVPEKLIVGKAFLRLLPIKKIDLHPGDYKQAQ
jgi:signal peptidase I